MGIQKKPKIRDLVECNKRQCNAVVFIIKLTQSGLSILCYYFLQTVKLIFIPLKLGCCIIMTNGHNILSVVKFQDTAKYV